jgi:hypothetical protein
MSSAYLSLLRVRFSPWLHISTGLIILLVLAMLGLSISILDNQVNHFFKFNQQIHQTSLDIDTLQRQRDCLIQFEQEKQKFPKIFTSFNQSNFSKEVQPEDIHRYFQKWQTLYRIETLNLKFNSRVIYKQSLDLWKVPITLSVKVLKDYQFYGLLSKIQNDLPGKISIKRFSLKRLSPLTPDMVKQITQGKKNISLFEGKIEFEWIHREGKELPPAKIKLQ